MTFLTLTFFYPMNYVQCTDFCNKMFLKLFLQTSCYKLYFNNNCFLSLNKITIKLPNDIFSSILI